jgi:hypothetical protein
MRSVDLRTRTDADVRPVDAVEFFDETLPDLGARNGHLAAPGARELGVDSLGIEIAARSWTLALDGDAVVVTPGTDDAPTVVRLDEEDLADLVHDIRTPVGFLSGGDLDLARGRFEDFLDWWVVLRSLLDDRPAHTKGAIDFRDQNGDQLDLGRAFTPDDDDEDMAYFLTEAGFLHLAGVFTQKEMDTISADMDAALPSYTPDDGKSWWATTGDGEHRAVRLQCFQQHSETTAAILADDRLARIGRLVPDGHRLGRPSSPENTIEALVKPIGIVEGISDVPWHKDCSLGRHSYQCCSMTIGISVTGADAESGQLRVVAGSHRALIQPAFARRDLDLPRVDLPTATGDITVHLSCTMHMSQPPVERERRVMYTAFRLPDPDGSSQAGLDKVARIRERAHKVVSQKPSPVATS